MSSAADAQVRPLDTWLCLALYDASRAMTARYRPLLAELGLTYPQYLVLSVLWEDGSRTIGELGARLRLDSGTLSPLVRRLESAGLVVRSRAAHDDRLTVVDLTLASERLRARAVEVPDLLCAATGLADDELADLVRRLREVVASLDAAAD